MIDWLEIILYSPVWFGLFCVGVIMRDMVNPLHGEQVK